MKKSEIILGHEYSNSDYPSLEHSKERRRKVVGMYMTVFERPELNDIYVTVIDTMSYGEVDRRYPKHSYDLLLTSFARWAKTDVT